MEAFYDDYTHIRPFTRTSLGQLAIAADFAKHQTEFLPWTKGIRQIIAYRGETVAMGYLMFCDVHLRALGLVNKNQLMLRAWV
jgi:hypothetical protein